MSLRTMEFFGGNLNDFFTFTLCDLHVPYITWSTKPKWVVCKQMEPFVLWQKLEFSKVGVFFSFEIIHVLLNLLPQPPATPKEVETWNWTKLNTLEKDLLGTLEKVLRNNMKKIRMLLNYEAGKEVPIQQKNVSMTQLGCYSLFFSLNAHSIHSVSLSIMKTWA
jgi:hypothetical protein